MPQLRRLDSWRRNRCQEAARRAAPCSESRPRRDGGGKPPRGDQKSRRRANWPVRFPPKPWGGAASNTPKVLGLLTFKVGGAEESDRQVRLGLDRHSDAGNERPRTCRGDWRGRKEHGGAPAADRHDSSCHDREKCLAAGMHGYAPKPIRAADLFDAIGNLFPDAVRTPDAALSAV